MRQLFSAAAVAALAMPCALAVGETQPVIETGCRGTTGTVLAGIVRDSTMALVPGATLTLDGGAGIASASDGRFRFPCVSAGMHRLTLKAEGFAPAAVEVKLPHPGEAQFVLQLDTVQIGVEVNADDARVESTQGTGESQTISGTQLQSLADDPDDLQRQLQQLGAAAGGNPANTTISVDGFNDSSKLPPKSSIAYIKVNPDQFSAEYREPPFDGGRIEVYTKPGQSSVHGALFATNSSGWMNAADPFSTNKAPVGKQRYGFELSGPIRKQGSDFALELEHRSIDNFGVVNATTLDDGGNPVAVNENVTTPQRLWVGQARVDWQLGAKNTFIATYSPNVNGLQNVGVGGQSLPETGYNESNYEHVLRLVDVTTISAHLMHEARVQLRWDGGTLAPNSAAPQVEVAGSFVSGGNTAGHQQTRRFVPEIIDDAILTTKSHTLKVGMDLTITHDNLESPTNFNGAYTFGGSSAAPVLDAMGVAVPGQVETISGIEQYRRARLQLPGGTPTAFSNVAGTPGIRFTQVNEALYVQDDWNVGKGVHLSGGVRYFYQSLPRLVDGATPRLGVLWSPTKKGTWTVHAHAGLFTGRVPPRVVAEVLREDGVNRVTSTVYNPVFCDASATAGTACNPFAEATPIRSERQFSPHLGQVTWGGWNVGGTRSLPGGWNLSADWYSGRLWNDMRSVNVNTPVDGVPTGVRPGVANLNVLQVNGSGQGNISAEFVGIEQHALKRVQLFFGGVRVQLVDDTDDDELATPQSAYTDAGEFAHRTNQPTWNLFGNASLTLPRKVVLSGNFNGEGDAHYNITTGYDNNGDGDFNDRPQYAAAGTPNAVATQYGLLVASGGDGVFPRNKGVMPWKFYLDSNVQRAFVLTRDGKAEHQQTLTINLRAANLLNHTNVTAVGGVLGSPSFGVPYAADTGRRVEAGVRYSF